MGERDAGKAGEVVAGVGPTSASASAALEPAFMKHAAERTSGLFVQINPDEVLAWRAFDLLATLNTPRLLTCKYSMATRSCVFLTETTMIAQGEEIWAITAVEGIKEAIPGKVIVGGNADAKPLFETSGR